LRNMVHLLESKGIRVFSLAVGAREVDAFLMWKGAIPYVFLNTHKTSEHSRYDAAHELGHLVLHEEDSPHGGEAELRANRFASAFLAVLQFGTEQEFTEKASFLGNSRGHFEEFVDELILTPDATLAQPPHLALPNYVYRLIALNRS
jgi:hypothetical protein